MINILLIKLSPFFPPMRDAPEAAVAKSKQNDNLVTGVNLSSGGKIFVKLFSRTAGTSGPQPGWGRTAPTLIPRRTFFFSL